MGKKPRVVSSKKKTAAKYKKSPNAPKRFKSAFIFFSQNKHKEIRDKLCKEGSIEKTTSIAKLVSQEWKNLSAQDREVWEEMARKDKDRYAAEKAAYTGPWKIRAGNPPKDSGAPKRPMSAFLAFSNCRRAGIKRKNPGATNADLSRILSKMWKEAPEEM